MEHDEIELDEELERKKNMEIGLMDKIEELINNYHQLI